MKVFLFHRVNPVRDSLWDPIDPEKFEKQIKYLSNKYNLVLLEDYILNKDYLSKDHQKTASIVFDDGYRDFKDYAYPILKKHSVPCSMYIVTNSIDNNTPIWTFVVDYLFQNSKFKHLTFRKGKELGFNDTKWNTDQERTNFAKQFKPKLKKLKDRERRIIIEDLKLNFNDVTLPNDLFLSWDDIRELQSDGVEFGSHTISHPMLANIDEMNVLKKELIHSRDRMKQEINSPIRTISYPIGSYNELVIEESKKAGYQIGLAVDQKSFNPKEELIFNIPRIELYNESMLKTKLRVNEVIPRIKKIIGR